MKRRLCLRHLNEIKPIPQTDAPKSMSFSTKWAETGRSLHPRATQTQKRKADLQKTGCPSAILHRPKSAPSPPYVPTAVRNAFDDFLLEVADIYPAFWPACFIAVALLGSRRRRVDMIEERLTRTLSLQSSATAVAVWFVASSEVGFAAGLSRHIGRHLTLILRKRDLPRSSNLDTECEIW